jgi:hypothetical protein
VVFDRAGRVGTLREKVNSVYPQRVYNSSELGRVIVLMDLDGVGEAERVVVLMHLDGVATSEVALHGFLLALSDVPGLAAENT